MPKTILHFLLVSGMLLGLFVSLPAQPARAAGSDRYVSTTGVDSAACTNSAAPCRTIAYAIAQSGATSADQIHIAAGTYVENLVINKWVDLIGAQENLTIIDGGGVDTTVTVNSGITANLRDLNVQNGYNPGAGGGIINTGSLALLHVKVSGNTAPAGGGIYNVGSLSLTDVFISMNTASSSAGGGLFTNSAADVLLSSVTLSNNTASAYSGGIHNQGSGMLHLTNVTITDNTAHFGGGMTVTAPASATIINSTIANNHHDAVAGADIGGIAGYGTISMANSIAYANEAEDCYLTGTFTSLGHNIDGDATCLTPAIALPSDRPSTNPLLGVLSKNGGYVPTDALLSGSPAIDSADPAYCPARDAASWPRPQDGNGDGTAVCDVGAFEDPSLAVFTSVGAQDGQVLESSETSNIGGTVNSTTPGIKLGDDATRRQFRGILSFRTGPTLPDTATITAVTLQLRKSTVVGGGNPVSIFHGFMLDIRKGVFGVTTLQPGDFQAAASKTYGPFSPAPVANWYSFDLSAGKGYVNRVAAGSGLTQIRVRFRLDDNNNAAANDLVLFSGNAAAANRPMLTIAYYAP